MDRRTVQAPLTLALKLLGGGGEQQLAFHVRGPSAAGDAWLLVPRLDPAGEPAQVAAAVQGVGPDGSAGGGKAKLHPLPRGGNRAQRPWAWTQLRHLAGLPRDGGTQGSSISGPTRGAACSGRTGAHSPTPLLVRPPCCQELLRERRKRREGCSAPQRAGQGAVDDVGG